MSGRPPKPLMDRFWDKVAIEGVPSGCWTWTASKTIHGYGKIENRQAHRISYELHRGPIPEGVMLLHKCDNRLCVNPSHVFFGTHQDNMDDMVRKGRSRGCKGSENGQSKLSYDDIAMIRCAEGVTQKQLAKLYNVNPSTISRIRLGQRWAT